MSQGGAEGEKALFRCPELVVGDVRDELENLGKLRGSTQTSSECVDSIKTNDPSGSTQPQPGLSTLHHVTGSWHCKTLGQLLYLHVPQFVPSVQCGNRHIRRGVFKISETAPVKTGPLAPGP